MCLRCTVRRIFVYRKEEFGILVARKIVISWDIRSIPNDDALDDRSTAEINFQPRLRLLLRATALIDSISINPEPHKFF